MRMLRTTLALLPRKLRRTKVAVDREDATDDMPDGRKLLLDMPAEKVIRLFENNSPTGT